MGVKGLINLKLQVHKIPGTGNGRHVDPCDQGNIPLWKCIGSHTISSAIWNKQKHEQIFQKPTKVHEPVGQVHFVVPEKFTSAYPFQIAWENHVIIYTLFISQS